MTPPTKDTLSERVLDDLNKWQSAFKGEGLPDSLVDSLIDAVQEIIETEREAATALDAEARKQLKDAEIATRTKERDDAIMEAKRRDQKWMDGINEIVGQKLDYDDPIAPNSASTALAEWAATKDADLAAAKAEVERLNKCCAARRDAIEALIGECGFQINEYLHRQFPATVGHIQLNDYFNQLFASIEDQAGADYLHRDSFKEKEELLRDGLDFIRKFGAPNSATAKQLLSRADDLGLCDSDGGAKIEKP